MFDCSFSFFFLGTPILLLTFVSLRGVDYLAELSRRGFVSLPYLISPILARPFLDTIKTAGAPACSAGEWGGVPSVPELSSSVLNRCFYACILMFSHFSCILHSSFCLGLASPVVLAFFLSLRDILSLFWSSMTFFITFCPALSIVFRDSLVPVRAPVCQAGFYQAWASRPVSPG